jgi:hypothetical protein
MVSISRSKGPNCWTVTSSSARGDKPLAEIQLAGGVYSVKPLKRLSKTEASTVAAHVDYRQWASIGDPPKGSVEARLERIDDLIMQCSGYFEDRGEFPEYVEKLDAAADRLAEVREELRLLRAPMAA